ncbi:SIS domain-containing protein [Streptomyces sp. NPDC006333]|uniref:SIS domain-containing protein n=1 Tax=unclassified Streptomyces TaxID=2593676 RepID=UPI0033ACA3B5
METLEPEVMVRQVESLAADLRELVGPVSRERDALFASADWASVGSVHLVGDGDSYYAGHAVELAFRSLAQTSCVATAALGFLEYEAPWSHLLGPGRPLVVGISSSGSTPRVVQAVARARRHGALTLALTGVPGSPLTQTAEHTLSLPLARPERSPGIRTYQASLLGLLLLAIRLGQARGRHSADETRDLERELTSLHEGLAATVDLSGDRCREVAALVSDAPVAVMAGSGPGFGTALFSAAKLIEGAGVFARGQDLEEWHHVERFAAPHDMPVFVIAPPGRSYWRAVEIAAKAEELGRRVVAVTHRDDVEVARHAGAVLPVAVRSREEFSPLLYHVFAGLLACRTAQRLGRTPFRTGPAVDEPART